MSTYPMRVSPDGKIVAVRSRLSGGNPWKASNGGYYSDDAVKDWTPLVSQPPRWKAEKLALDEYSMLWEQGKGTAGDHMKAMAHTVGVLLYGDNIALDPRDKESGVERKLRVTPAEGGTLLRGRCSVCSWSVLSGSRENLEYSFDHHACNEAREVRDAK